MITVNQLQKYLQKLHDSGVSSSIIEKRLGFVENFLKWAHGQGKIDTNTYEQLSTTIANKLVNLTTENRTDGQTQASFSRQEAQTIDDSEKIRVVKYDNVSLFERLQIVLKLQTYGIKERVLNILRRTPVVNNVILANRQMAVRPESSADSGVANGPQNDGQIEYQRSKIEHRRSNIELSTPHFIGIGLTLLFIAVLGAGIYNRYFAKSPTAFGYASSPTFPGTRTLSFQGRLTDSLGNPITTATNVVFKLYDASSGGSTLYTGNTCSITPDSDGIFNVLIGSDCTPAISNTVFTENTSVFLEVAVGSETLTPRQAIATVGYALNSETLQGIPIGTGNTIPFIPYFNSSSNLVIGATNPSIQSAAGTFTIQGATVRLTSSSGNINIVPSSGNVGIGNTQPASMMSILGNLSVGSSVYISTAAPTNGAIIEGNVGIGTTSPGNQLDVAGLTNITGGAAWGTGSLSGEAAGEHLNLGYDTTGNIGYVRSVNAGTAWTDLRLAGSQISLWTATGGVISQSMTINTAGNVGIGYTNIGTAKLSVNGNVGIGTTNASSFALEVYNSTQNALGPAVDATLDIGSTARQWKDIYVSGRLCFDGTDCMSVSAANAGGWTDDGTTVRLTTQTDNVAIGASIARNKLDVQGAVGIGTTYADALPQTNMLTVSGNVGIGISNPSEKLVVTGNIAPSSASGADLGTSSLGWDDLWLNGRIVTDNGVDIVTSGNVSYLNFGGNNQLSLGASSGTLNTELTTLNFRAVTHTTGSSITDDRFSLFNQPTITASGTGVTVTNAATVYITDAPNTSSAGGSTPSIINPYAFWVDAGASRFDGNVGIGTTAAGSPLDIGTNITGATSMTLYAMKIEPNLSGTVSSSTPMTAFYNSYNFPTISVGGTAPHLTNLYINYIGSSVGSGSTVSNVFGIYIAAPSGSGVTSNKYALVTEAGAGNVGLGVTYALNRLDVNGAVAIGSLPAAALPQANSLYVSGNVGIGTTSPTAKLEVYNSGAATVFKVGKDTTGKTFGLFQTSADTDGYFEIQIFKAQDVSYGDLILNRTSGNVAVGNDTSPASKLVVAGTAQLKGSTTTTGLHVNSSGNVGVGNQSQLALFHAGAAVTDYSSYSFTNTAGVFASVGTDNTGAQSNVITLMRDGIGGVVYAAAAAFDLSRWQSDGVNARTQLHIRLADTDTATLTDVMSLRSNGNVGIGTTAPTSRLSIAGNLSVGGSYATYTSGAPTNGLIVLGNTGIGISSPFNKLDVNGAVAIGAQPGAALPQSNSLYVSDNVGIGVSSPQGKLDVRDGNVIFSDKDVAHAMYSLVGSSQAYGQIAIGDGTNGGISVEGYSSDQSTTGVTGMYLIGTIGSTNPGDAVPAVIIRGRRYNGGTSSTNLGDAETVLRVQNAGTDLITVLGSGNMGIGYTNVGTAKLSVNGNVGIGTTNASSFALEVYNSTQNALGPAVDATLDIGSTARQWKDIYVSGRLCFDGTDCMSVSAANAGGWTDDGTTVRLTTQTDNVAIGASIARNKLDVQGAVGIGTTYADALPQTNMLTVSGNVGIGTSDPSQKLHVAGSVNISSGSSYKINGTDVLTANILGTGVTSSSLVSVGALNIGSITSGFGSIDTGADNILTTGTIGVASNTTYLGNIMTLGVGATFAGAGDALTLSGNSANINFTSSTGIKQIITGGSTGLALMPGGNVGIGYTNIGTAKLSVNGNVGIGTTNPLERLQINNIGTSGQVDGIRVVSTKSSATTEIDGILLNLQGPEQGESIVGINFGLDPLETNLADASGNYSRLAQIRILQTSGAGAALQFLNKNDEADSMSIRMHIDRGGNIGIGYTNVGTAKLSVNGNVGIGTTNASSFALEVYNSTQNALGPAVDATLDIGSTARQWKDIYVSGRLCFDGTDCMSVSAANAGGWTDDGTTVRLTTQTDNVAIGASIARNKLDVQGAVGIGTTYADALPQTNMLTVSGNVGIGTTAPGTTLGVVGSVGIGGSYAVYTSAPTNGLIVLGNVGVGISSPFNKLDVNGAVAIGTQPGAALPQANSLYVSGNTGIGTTSPTSSLEIASTITGITASNHYALRINPTLSGTLSASNPVTAFYNSYDFPTISVGGTAPHLTNLYINYIGSSVGSGSTVSNVFGTYIAAPSGSGVTSNKYALVTEAGAGNVGLGVTYALNRLDVNGAVAIGSLPAAALPQANSLYVSGNVGIGTTNPSQLLNIRGTGTVVGRIESTSSSGTRDAQLQLFVNNEGANDPAGSILFRSLNGSGSEITQARILAQTYTGGATGAFISFSTNNGGTLFERMRINESGNVGIGYTNLGTARLSINGNVGIGITNALNPLDVNGSVAIGSLPTVALPQANSLYVSGNVGVGTSAPGSKLGVFGSVGIGGSYSVYTGAPTNGLIVLGNTGIGISSPFNALDVNGAVAIGAQPGAALPQANSLYVSGNVGIGTSDPSQKLHVAGSVNISSGSSYKINGTDVLTANILGTGVTSSSLVSVGALNIGSITSGFGSIDTGADNILTTGTIGVASNTTYLGNIMTLGVGATFAGAGDALTLSGNSANINFTSSTGVKQIITGGSTGLALMPGGNVGIGYTNIGTAKLSVNGNVGIGTTNAGGALEIATNITGVTASNHYALRINPTLSGTLSASNPVTAFYNSYDFPTISVGGTAPHLTNLYINYIGSSVGSGSTVSNVFGTYIAAPSGSGVTSNKYALVTEAGAGNVGLGVTYALNRLDVNGAVAIGSLPAAALPQANSLYVSGNVGIGTTSPDYLLVVGPDSGGATGQNTLRFGEAGWANPTAPGTVSNGDKILFWDSATQKVGLGFAADNSLWLQASTTGSAIRFFTGNTSTAPSERMTISAAGNVGIGYTNLGTAKLSINGNVGIGTTDASTALYVNGTITADSLLDTGNTIYGIDPSGSGLSYAGTGYSLAIANGAILSATSGNVGIGTTAPGPKLGVFGSVGIGGSYSVYTGAPTNGLIVLGNTGIGISSPFNKLDVNGAVAIGTQPGAALTTNTILYVSGNTGIGTTNPAKLLSVVQDGSWNDSTDITNSQFLIKEAANNMRLSLGVGNSIAFIQSSETGVGYRSLILQPNAATSGGNVGIGTTAPASRLSLSGNLAVGQSYATFAAPTNGVIIQGNVGIGVSSPLAVLDVNGVGAFGLGSATAPGIAFRTDLDTGVWSSGADSVSMSSGGVEFFRIASGGNIGIGRTVTSPTNTLQVNGTVRLTKAVTDVAQSGLTTPSFANSYLHIGGREYTSGGGAYRFISFGWNNGTQTHVPAFIGTRATSEAGSTSADLVLATRSVTTDTQPTERLIVKDNGNIGIGTTAPGTTLGVVGSVGIGGSYAVYTSAPTNGLIILGNTGIGISSPFNKLDVNGSVAIGAQPGAALPQSNSLYVSGNTGIGTTNPSLFKLQVNGNIGPDAAPTITSISQTITDIGSTANDLGNFVSGGKAITIGKNNNPVIAYYDDTNDNLEFTACGNVSCSSGNTTTTLDSGGLVGKWPSVAIGTDGYPVISYWDETNGDLKLYKCSNATCTSGSAQSIATGVNVFGDSGTSLAIGSDSYPVVSYSDTTDSDLEFIKCGNADCSSGNTITTIDSTNLVGIESSVAIGTDGFPIISYRDSTNDTLKVAKCNNLDCSSNTQTGAIDTTGGREVTMAIGIDGLPIIAHLYNGNILRVTKCGNTACSSGNTSTSVDSSADVGHQAGITIGLDGFPVISHYDNTNGNLKVVKCGTVSCSSGNVSTTLESTNNVGTDTSIALGNDGLPIITYYYVTGTDIRTLKCATPSCNQTSGNYFASGSDLGSRGTFFKNVYATQYWGQQFQIADFADIAENYSVEDHTIGAGDIVKVKSGTTLEKTDSEYDEKILGVVSTKPGITLSQEKGDKSLALAGRVPVKVTIANDNIHTGDYITASSLPGVGMKSVKPGIVIGKALQDTVNWSTTSCSQADSVSSIQWPEDPDGTNSTQTCYSLPDGTFVGKIMVFVTHTWYDPTVAIASTGDLEIKKSIAREAMSNTATDSASLASSSASLATPSASLSKDYNLPATTYNLISKSGEIVQKIGAFSEAVFGIIRSGLIESEEVITHSFTAVSSDIRHLTSKILHATDATIARLVVDEKITSPLVETENLIATGTAKLNEVATNTIQPQENDLTVILGSEATPESTQSGSWTSQDDVKGGLAKLIIKGLEGKTVASIDAGGNASFSGQVVVDSLEVTSDATISGTLTADSLIAQSSDISHLTSEIATISGTLTAREVRGENITNLESNVASQSSNIRYLTSNIDDLGSNINSIQALLAKIQNEPLPDPRYYQNIDSTVILGSEATPESTQSGSWTSQDDAGVTTQLLTNSLIITGKGNFFQASVADMFSVGNVYITNDSILSLASELKLSALSSISFFDGAVTIAKDGTLTTKGEIIAQGGIRTNEIKGINNSDNIDVILGSEATPESTQSGSWTSQDDAVSSEFRIKNQSGDTVAAINASGSARFNEISLNKYLEATSSAVIIAAADNLAKNGLELPAIETTVQTAGNGIVPENTGEIVIYNERIKDDSLIYLTPTTSLATNLTVLEKQTCATYNPEPITQNTCRPFFKVGISTLSPTPVRFNWLIIN